MLYLFAKHGTLLHYAQGSTITEKTRDKSGYAGTNNWSYRDKKQILSGTEQMSEMKGKREENDQ